MQPYRPTRARTSRHHALLLLLVLGPVAAQAQVFEDGFEAAPAPALSPLFPTVNGDVQLPPSPTATQLQWFMDKLQTGAVTTAADVQAHFADNWISGIGVQPTIDFIHSVRDTYPDAYIADVIVATPTRVVTTLHTPHNANIAYFQFGARFAGSERINFIGVNPYNHNTVQYVADQALTLPQAVDKFMTFSSDASLLVARIEANGSCTPIQARNADTLRATASIFKTWVVGATATAVRDGVLSADDTIALTSADRAPPTNDGIALEVNGTAVSVIDMARFMIGLSDNTATDHLHEALGRPRIDAFVSASGVADPDVLRPLLKIKEQFHVFRTLQRAQADAYVDGTEAYQYGVVPQLEALGTAIGNLYHTDLIIDGTWRATPNDICRTFATLRDFEGPALELVDQAMGTSAGQPNVRNRWDRVWYKGGSLAQFANQYMVFTHAWMLERNGERPLVLVALSNSPTGSISGNAVAGSDIFDIQSVTGRMLELMSEM